MQCVGEGATRGYFSSVSFSAALCATGIAENIADQIFSVVGCSLVTERKVKRSINDFENFGGLRSAAGCLLQTANCRDAFSAEVEHQSSFPVPSVFSLDPLEFPCSGFGRRRPKVDFGKSR